MRLIALACLSPISLRWFLEMIPVKKRPAQQSAKVLDISPTRKRKSEDEVEKVRQKPKPFRKQDDDDLLPPSSLRKTTYRERPLRPVLPEGSKSKLPKYALQVNGEEQVRKAKLALPAPVPPRRVSKLDTTDMTSIMGDSAEEISQLLESSSNESATSMIHKRLLQSLIDTVAHAENNVRVTKGQKGVYQLNGIITSIRELLIDVQSTRDKGVLGETIVERVVRPAFLDIAMELAREHEMLKVQLRTVMNNERFLKVEAMQTQFLTKVASSIQAKYGELRDGVIKSIQGG